MIDRIIAKLQKLDQQIEAARTEAQSSNNKDRSKYLYGKADGLAQAYGSIKGLVEGTPELARWEEDYFQVEN
jgi:hypothetical protein